MGEKRSWSLKHSKVETLCLLLLRTHTLRTCEERGNNPVGSRLGVKVLRVSITPRRAGGMWWSVGKENVVHGAA